MLAMITTAEARLLVIGNRLQQKAMDTYQHQYLYNIMQMEASTLKDKITAELSKLEKQGKAPKIESLSLDSQGVVYDLSQEEYKLIQNLRILKVLHPKSKMVEKLTSRYFEWWSDCELEKLGISSNEQAEAGTPGNVINFDYIRNKRKLRAAYTASI